MPPRQSTPSNGSRSGAHPRSEPSALSLSSLATTKQHLARSTKLDRYSSACALRSAMPVRPRSICAGRSTARSTQHSTPPPQQIQRPCESDCWSKRKPSVPRTPRPAPRWDDSGANFSLTRPLSRHTATPADWPPRASALRWPLCTPRPQPGNRCECSLRRRGHCCRALGSRRGSSLMPVSMCRWLRTARWRR